MVMTDDATPTNPAADISAFPAPAAPMRVARLRELSPKTMWLTAVMMAVLTAGAVVTLWWPATAGLNGAELVTARLDALKIGLSIGVGSGGVVALYLAWRRQHSTEADLDNRERALAHRQEVAAVTIAHQDRVARATEHDAAERRLTELYLKAVEQLGSAQAAVRHGGLYALERVAQDNPAQRQTVVDVVCAYLRNPYTPLSAASGPRRLGVRRPLLRSTVAHRMPTPSPGTGHDRQDRLQEREVRLTAQRLLRRHLQPGDNLDQLRDTFWADIDLDLTGATLIDFTLTDCRVGTTTFREATFTGPAGFNGAAFTGDAQFEGATFTDAARFDDAAFSSVASFARATFNGDARFYRVSFTGNAWFGWAIFTRNAWFAEATIVGYADFGKATFTGNARFEGVTFSRNGKFEAATFNGDALFRGVTFSGDAQFGSAIFTSVARFGGATFTRDARFDEATFTKDVIFSGANFNCDARFDEVTFNGDALFHNMTFTGDAVFDGATRKGFAFDPVKREA